MLAFSFLRERDAETSKRDLVCNTFFEKSLCDRNSPSLTLNASHALQKYDQLKSSGHSPAGDIFTSLVIKLPQHHLRNALRIHDFANFLGGHRHFVESGTDQIHAALAGEAVYVFPIKLLVAALRLIARPEPCDAALNDSTLPVC